VHPEDRPERDQQFGKVLEGTEVVSEARYVKKDGTYAWTRTQGRPILEDGRVVGIRGVLADITERKEAEKALRESEERFALAMEASKDGL
jgi:PAS domain S-box-containing protein